MKYGPVLKLNTYLFIRLLPCKDIWNYDHILCMVLFAVPTEGTELWAHVVPDGNHPAGESQNYFNQKFTKLYTYVTQFQYKIQLQLGEIIFNHLSLSTNDDNNEKYISSIWMLEPKPNEPRFFRLLASPYHAITAFDKN